MQDHTHRVDGASFSDMYGKTTALISP